MWISGALLLSRGAVRAQDTAAAPAGAPPPAPTVTTPASGEPEVTVDELVRRALEHNPQIPIARLTEEAARQHLQSLRTLANPTLELVPAVGAEVARDESVLLSQPLDVFGQRRAQASVAAAELRAAQAQTTSAERALIVAVKNAATDLFVAQEAESLATVQVEVAQLFRDAAARRAQLGDVPPVQVQRADLELLRAQNDLTTAASERLNRGATLNQLIGQPPETPLRVALPLAPGATDLLRVAPGVGQGATNAPPPLAPPARGGETAGATAPAASSEASRSDSSPLAGEGGRGGMTGLHLDAQRRALLPFALTARPDMLAAQATLEARRAQVDVLRRERWPHVEVQVRRAPFFGRPDSGYAVRLDALLPVFDFGSLKRERRAAEADVRGQEAAIALLRSQVATQLEQALLRLGQQQATVQRYRTGIVPLAVDLLRKSQIGYAAGATTYLEVLDAERSLRQVQSEYLQSLAGVRTGEAALESALGVAPPANIMSLATTPDTPTTSATTPAEPGSTPRGGR